MYKVKCWNEKYILLEIAILLNLSTYNNVKKRFRRTGIYCTNVLNVRIQSVTLKPILSLNEKVNIDKMSNKVSENQIRFQNGDFCLVTIMVLTCDIFNNIYV